MPKAVWNGHAIAEAQRFEEVEGYVKWFVGIMFLQTGILASLIGWFVS